MELLAHDLSFSYGEKTVLAGVSLRLRPGCPVVLLGGSGGGKTTLLRLLAGLEKPLSGQVRWSGGGTVSVVFQEDRLFPQLTVWENLRLTAPGLGREEGKEALCAMGLEEWVLDSFPDELSGGMARRVSLCRGLLFPADAYLLDEPFRGLDEESHRLCREEILRRCGEKILLVVSHDPADAPAMGAVPLVLDQVGCLGQPEGEEP